jgi:hypothetical protein
MVDAQSITMQDSADRIFSSHSFSSGQSMLVRPILILILPLPNDVYSLTLVQVLILD